MNARNWTGNRRPPLDQQRLDELALRYVGRFATTQAKLRTYLARKLRERGWEGDREPDLDALASRFAALGYIDDQAFALAKARSLTGRGFGRRRVDENLRLAGVADEDGAAAREHAEAGAEEAALRFAERRRIGPFAEVEAEPRQREKWIAAMIRAGHGFALARTIAELAPGADVDPEALREQRR